MVKFYSTHYTYDYSFPAVSLAYFLRYPNPYSTHVRSTDTISRSFDAITGTLTTTRLHLKRSKLPSAVLKLLPRSLLGSSASGDSQTYILETSKVNVREGWMETESRNLEWTGVLSVIERQTYTRIPQNAEVQQQHRMTDMVAGSKQALPTPSPTDQTDVTTTVQLVSALGQPKFRRSRKLATEESGEEPVEMQSFFKTWSTAGLRRSIESIGLRRAEKSQPNAKRGMGVVLERLREGGLVAVLEGMRRDRESDMAPLGHGKH